MNRLLALDLSTSVGWSRPQPPGRPRFGTVVLEGPDLAWKLGLLLRWLDDQYMVDPFDAIAWERPLLTPTDTVDLLELLYGCAGVCYAFAGKHKLPWREVSVEDVKKGLTGKPRAKKEEMLYAARRTLNWPVNNHHEADAGAVGVIAYARLWPKVRAA
jgi:Holliday junction resolvasome RuvABC endonuclease subunit